MSLCRVMILLTGKERASRQHRLIERLLILRHRKRPFSLQLSSRACRHTKRLRIVSRNPRLPKSQQQRSLLKSISGRVEWTFL
jgi:hypothetical protein